MVREERQEVSTFEELQGILATLEDPNAEITGEDLVDLYDAFLDLRVPQEKIRPALQRLAKRWRRADFALTPHQLCALYTAHHRLNCYTPTAFRALGLRLLHMDLSQFQIEDVVEILSVNKKFMDNLQDKEFGKSFIYVRMVERHRRAWGTTPVVQVLLTRAEQFADEELDVRDTVALLDAVVGMEIHRPLLLAKLLRRVTDLQEGIEGTDAVRLFHLVASIKDHTEGSVQALRMLLHKTEEYVQRIRDEESRLRQLRELGAEAPLSLIRDRQEDLEAQRRAARQAAADVTNAVLGVAEGFQAYFPFLNPESERRDKATLCNQIVKAAQLQGVALQTQPDLFVGPPFLVREVTATLRALGNAAAVGTQWGIPDLGNVTVTHDALVEFCVERAKAIPSELYAPRDQVAVLHGLTLLMWRDVDLVQKIAQQAIVTNDIFSPLQVEQIMAHMERLKVFNSRFNTKFYFDIYAGHMIDAVLVVCLVCYFIFFVVFVHDTCRDPETGVVWADLNRPLLQ